MKGEEKRVRERQTQLYSTFVSWWGKRSRGEDQGRGVREKRKNEDDLRVSFYCSFEGHHQASHLHDSFPLATPPSSSCEDEPCSCYFFLLEHHYLVPLFSLYSLVFSSSTRSFILSFALFFLFIHDRIVLGSKLADRQTHIQERERERWGVDWGKSWGRWWYNWEKEWGASFSSTRHSFFEQNFTFPIFKGWTHTTTFLHTCYVCYVDVTCTVVCLKHKDLSLPSSLCILFIHGWNKVCGVCLCVFLLSYTLPFNGSDEDRNGKDRRGWWWRGWKGKKGFSVVVVLCTMFLPLFFFFLIPAQHPAF